MAILRLFGHGVTLRVIGLAWQYVTSQGVRVSVTLPLLLIHGRSGNACLAMQDYWHHWEDVTVGFLLGCLCAFTSYRQHYPGIASMRAGQAYITIKGRLGYMHCSTSKV